RWYTLGPGWPSQTRNVARVYLRSRVFVEGSVREETAALCIGLRSPAKPCQETHSVLGGTAMRRLGLEREMVDRRAYERAVGRLREQRFMLPMFTELADPMQIPARIRTALVGADPDEPH